MANGPTLPPQAYTREILAVAFQWLQTQPDSIRKLAQSPDALVGLYLRAQRYGSAAPETDAPVSSQNFISDLKNLAEGLKQFEDPKAAGLSQDERQVPRTESRTAGASKTTQSLQSGPFGTTATSSSMSLYANSQSIPQPGVGTAQPPSQTAAQPPAGASVNPYAHVPPTTAMPANPFLAWAQAQSAAQLQAQQNQVPQPPAANQVAVTYASQSSPALVQSAGDFRPHDSSFEIARYLNPTSQAMIQEVKAHFNLTSDAEVLNMLVSIAYKSVKNLIP